MTWLLMPWLLALPGDQQQWYWTCRSNRSLPRNSLNIYGSDTSQSFTFISSFLWLSEISCNLLTHLPLVTHICINQLCQLWFSKWLGTCMALSHYLNQCWIIINGIFGNKFQWNSNSNTKIFNHVNASENIVWETAGILFKGLWVKRWRPGQNDRTFLTCYSLMGFLNTFVSWFTFYWDLFLGCNRPDRVTRQY